PWYYAAVRAGKSTWTDPYSRVYKYRTSKILALGLDKGFDYEESVFSDVKSGQIYMALTDGLFEAFNRDGEMFGKDRVRDMIRNSALNHYTLRLLTQPFCSGGLFLE
ncbi:MAG: SpoIIE family protein phosphatase, partial [Deltaproteobacteria bacterium]|nr:SpoIIE family protein phosphatase [Deltaproteobacteria bacterium]